MKKTFFALALLVSAVVTATVKVDVKARCDKDSVEQSFALNNTENQVVFEHDSGVKTMISLERENIDSADLAIVVTKGEKELLNSHVRTVYGKSETFACSANNVDAELIIVASQLSLITQ